VAAAGEEELEMMCLCFAHGDEELCFGGMGLEVTFSAWWPLCSYLNGELYGELYGRHIIRPFPLRFLEVGGVKQSTFCMARRKTMITMGSPDLVWINANEIISSWYLLDAVCVTPPR
jgi:hypothetical protein